MPKGQMTAEELIALYADDSRHSNALRYEIRRAPMAEIIRLAYGEHSNPPLAGAPDALASQAYDEMERRERAANALRAELANRHV